MHGKEILVFNLLIKIFFIKTLANTIIFVIYYIIFSRLVDITRNFDVPLCGIYKTR